MVFASSTRSAIVSIFAFTAVKASAAAVVPSPNGSTFAASDSAARHQPEWASASAKKLSSYNVASYVEKPKDDPVTLTVTFALLPDGTSYPQQVLLDVKAKNLQVKITNSGHKKAGA